MLLGSIEVFNAVFHKTKGIQMKVENSNIAAPQKDERSLSEHYKKEAAWWESEARLCRSSGMHHLGKWAETRGEDFKRKALLVELQNNKKA